MKKLITTGIIGDVGAPFTGPSLDNLQANFGEIPDAIIKGMLGSYTTNDVIVLYGVAITITGSGSIATWTAGAIYYNGEVYQVSAGTLTKTSGIFLYSITDSITNEQFDDGNSYPWIEVRTVTITSGTSGTGIADYGASSMKVLNQWNLSSVTGSATVTSAGSVCTIGGVRMKWIKKANTCTLNYSISVNLESLADKKLSVFLTLPIPSVAASDSTFSDSSCSVMLTGGSKTDMHAAYVEIEAASDPTKMLIFLQLDSLSSNLGVDYPSAVFTGQIIYQVAP
jgi:hypothetical protein